MSSYIGLASQSGDIIPCQQSNSQSFWKLPQTKAAVTLGDDLTRQGSQPAAASGPWPTPSRASAPLNQQFAGHSSGAPAELRTNPATGSDSHLGSGTGKVGLVQRASQGLMWGNTFIFYEEATTFKVRKDAVTTTCRTGFSRMAQVTMGASHCCGAFLCIVGHLAA